MEEKFKGDQYLEIILKKMSEFAGYKYEDLNFTDDSHLNLRYKTIDAEEKFINWFSNYLYSLKLSELRYIVEYPALIHKRKKKCKAFAENFTAWYGFMSYENIFETK